MKRKESVKDARKRPAEPEPKVKLYRLEITEEIEAGSIEEARRLAKDQVDLIDRQRIEEAVSRVTRGKYSSRADRLEEARSMIAEAKSIVEELKGEIEEWHSNLPDNLQDGEKGNALEECASNLEDVESALEEAETGCDSVEFPGMY